jgi:hypothetical protein
VDQAICCLGREIRVKCSGTVFLGPGLTVCSEDGKRVRGEGSLAVRARRATDRGQLRISRGAVLHLNDAAI